MGRWLMVFLVAYAGFLLAWVPASWVLGHLMAAQGGSLPLALEGVEGTLWHGRAAQLRLHSPVAGSVSWPELRWTMLWSQWLTGHGGVEIHLGQDVTPTWQARVRFAPWLGSPLEVEGGKGHWDLTFFRPLMPSFMPPLEGRVDLEDISLQWGSTVWPLRVSGTMTGEGLLVAAPMNLMLGRVQARFVSDEATPGLWRATLEDQGGGQVQVKLALEVRPDGGYQVTGHLAARDTHNAALGDLLRSVGSMGPDGRVRVVLTGRL
ncbi:MAG: type II secretion system protein N [Magnetococcus sp. WYHC-3]